MFDKIWFEKHQKVLLWLLNSSLTKRWFRKCLMIERYDFPIEKRIGRIRPDAYYGEAKWLRKKYIDHPKGLVFYHKDLKLHRKLIKKYGYKMPLRPYYYFDVRTYPKYSIKLHQKFYWIWRMIHTWDYFADAFIPKLSFGFTAFTANPTAGVGGPTGDCCFLRDGVKETWATIKAAAGNLALNERAAELMIYVLCSTTSNQFADLGRFGMTFANPGGTITAATLSVYGTAKSDEVSNAPEINVYGWTPSVNYNFGTGEFVQFGSTAYCDSLITYANYSITGYNDFVLNATGITAIATGVAKLGFREVKYDVGASTPTWGSNNETKMNAYTADNGSNEPKLVGTYTEASTFISKINIM
jgi:hypothetical protein